MVTKTVTLTPLGNGHMIYLPKIWIDSNKLHPGDKLLLEINGNITIKPIKKQKP